MIRTPIKLLTFLSILALVAGCSTNSSYKKIKDDNIIRRVESAASKLMSSDDTLGETNRIIVTSFANVDDLSTSSRFGRILAQQVAAEIADDGYTVVEILMGEALRIDAEQGEFLLSREVAELGKRHDADAVVVGTYAEAVEHIYITLKLVRATDSVVLAAYSFDVKLGPDARRMIR